MPIKRFKCEDCDKQVRKLNPKEDVTCECGKVMKEMISEVSDPISLEKKDPWRNKQIMKDLDGIMKSRAKKHFVEHVMDEKIQEYGPGHGLAAGWLNPDGTKKKIDDYS